MMRHHLGRTARRWPANTTHCRSAAPCSQRHVISGPNYTHIVQALPSMVPFVAPEEQERVRGRPFKARLGANECNFGPSPKAVRTMQEVAGDVWKYGDPKSHDLRMAISDLHDVSPSNIVVGEGIDGLLANCDSVACCTWRCSCCQPGHLSDP